MGEGNAVYPLNVMDMMCRCGLTCKTVHKGHMSDDLIDGKQPEEETLPGQSKGHCQGPGKKGVHRLLVLTGHLTSSPECSGLCRGEGFTETESLPTDTVFSAFKLLILHCVDLVLCK